MRLLPLPRAGSDDMVREAAWLARCVGRGDWAPLSESDIVELGARMRPVDLESGTLLFPQGATSEAVWVVRRGRVELTRREGRRKTILRILYPGDVDGDISLILQMPLPYSARAVDRVQGLRLGEEDFEWLIASRPGVSRRWLSSIAGRLMHTERRILQLAGRDLPSQLAMLLLDEQHDGAVDLPQESLGLLLGVRRPSLNKALRAFEREDLVRLSYRRVEISDEEGLARLAGRARES